ncbi:CidA/LrgA family protein [Lutibacter citreus]|uniref:CidA/LrgA family protein n=1 Tax=Lutibacter citreus TaxID=2138210 RepID=UPI000DBE7353|nr:CidA/LrgA family protein [Lutibacter citreus]
MNLIKQVAIILGFWFAGELLSYITKIPIPGSILGMLLIVLALEFKIIKPTRVKLVANFLLNNMAMFFIPAGVGIMCHFKILKQEWLPISVAIVISALLVLTVVGKLMERKND